MSTSITAIELKSALAGRQPPLVIDVRRPPAFHAAPDMAAGALRRDPGAVAGWAKTLPRAASIVTYCVHGHEVSQNAAKALREIGISARFLEGGLEEGWKAAGGGVVSKPKDAATRWVTRERPKIDRIACPWLIRRFIDANAVFLFVMPSEVTAVAERFKATPFDIEGVFWSHRGETCTFDTMIEELGLKSDPLKQLAKIVRGADTARPDLAPQSAGLLAASLGYSRMYRDDLEQLEAAIAHWHAVLEYDPQHAEAKRNIEQAQRILRSLEERTQQ